MSLLVLSEHDVERLLSMDACVETMTDVLAALARGELYQPLRFVLRPPDASGLMGFMPAHRTGADGGAFSLKEIMVVPGNPARGLDAHQGGVLLHDGETGQLRALLNASPITAIRTAAVSAVATRALARPDARTVAIVGTGVQGKAHAEAMRAILDDPEIRLVGRDVREAEEAIRGADVVCTCTTSPEPVVERDWLAPGTHVNAVGASVPGARELDEETIRDATFVVDRRESALNEAGELLIPGLGEEQIAAELGEVLIGMHPGRTSTDELTVFKSLGLGVEDLAAAELVVARAHEQGAGVEVDF
jgi:ornithine cyclodeaminase/alanine dehydrogenase-like protein (mu-crystallin family)